jgi:hypothetical protein
MLDQRLLVVALVAEDSALRRVRFRQIRLQGEGALGGVPSGVVGTGFRKSLVRLAEREQRPGAGVAGSISTARWQSRTVMSRWREFPVALY